jgi:hypothetical protein
VSILIGRWSIRKASVCLGSCRHPITRPSASQLFISNPPGTCRKNSGASARSGEPRKSESLSPNSNCSALDSRPDSPGWLAGTQVRYRPEERS